MGQEEVVADVWVICRNCGQRHQLKGGMEAPVYWCRDNLQKLVEGDEVEYDEIDPLDDIARTLNEAFKPYKNIRKWNLLGYPF